MSSEVPWSLAARVASRVAGTYPLEGSYHMVRLAEEAPGLVARAGRMVEEETGLTAGGEPEVAVVSRQEWAKRNLGSFAAMLAPAEEKLAARFSGAGPWGRGGAGLARRVVAAETGALLGFLARRVLGQYELVLPTGEGTDSVALVGANVLALERTHQFRPSEFRMWLALHECTHRLQFRGVPWMRGYFMGMVGELMESAVPEPGRLARVATEVIESARNGRPVLGEAGLLGLFATPTQREIIDRVQALMSLLEGHGHVIMDRIGARTLVTQARMSHVLKLRRTDPRTAAFFRLTGLEMKLRQYELGERFVLAVEQRAGWEALDHAWQSPESLPTRREIEEPERWLARVA